MNSFGGKLAVVTGGGTMRGSAWTARARRDFSFAGVDMQILLWFTLHISY